MQYFFADKIDGSKIYFDPAEVTHLQKSLRKRIGDVISVLDGNGSIFRCQIERVGRHNVLAHIVDKVNVDRNPCKLHIAVAPTKNMNRFEWFVEKATELGISEITPLLTQYVERHKMNRDRLRRIAISAIKQSGCAYLPRVHPMITLETFLAQPTDYNQRLIAHCGEEPKPFFSDILQSGKSALVLIGPEGDFDTGEISLAKELNFTEISLGNQRLRTETACIFVTAMFNMINHKL